MLPGRTMCSFAQMSHGRAKMIVMALGFESDDRVSKSQRCYECGGEYLLIFFRFDRRPTRLTQARARCIGCELSARTRKAQANRIRKKAGNARTRHAHTYRERQIPGRFVLPSYVRTSEDFYREYDWDTDQMAHDIEHASQNGCPYCWQLFSTMEGGLKNITLDIVDPRLPPYYRTNVRWCCNTCNREKQRTPPDLWGAKLSMWKLWRENQQKLMTDPEALGFLPFFVDAVPRP
jgi:hypothetical protein